MRLSGLSARTTNMPGVEYIAVMILRFGRRAADAGEGLVRHLALHERDVEPALLEQRHVLGAALGVVRLDDERGVGLPLTVSTKAAP